MERNVFTECFEEILTRIKVKYFDQNSGDIKVDIAKLEENLSNINPIFRC